MTLPGTVVCVVLLLLCIVLRMALARARRTILALELQVVQARAKQQHEELRLSRRAAIDAIKDDLIGNVSHELRTPLTSMRAALGLLSAGLAGSLDAKGDHLLRIATTNTDRLIRLVTDILDLERMESGRAGLQLRRCSLTHLVQQAMETMAAMAEGAQVTMQFTSVESPYGPPVAAPPLLPGLPSLSREAAGAMASPDDVFSDEERQPSGPTNKTSLRAAGEPAVGDRRRHDRQDTSGAEPAFFDADADRILQVLGNLLSNAIKFSPPGGAITIYLVASPDVLHLRVSDRGRGIPEDKLEVIFDRFQQVEVTDSRQKGGTGLGLAICRTIVQQHGGAIWAERNADLGATLCVDLPRIQRFSDQAVSSGGRPLASVETGSVAARSAAGRL